MYCFDTDVIAAALSADPPIHLVRRLARTPAGEQCTTSVTVSELAYAASRAGRPDLVERLADTVLAAQTVLPFDEAAAAIYGRVRAELEQVGTRMDEPSLRIAAITLANDLTLVTGSVRVFAHVPRLRIENWLEPDGLDVLADDAGAVEVGDELARRRSDGVVRHPGVVPTLEARVRAVAERATHELEDTSQLEG